MREPPLRPVEFYDQTIERTERNLMEYLEAQAAPFRGRTVRYKVALTGDVASEIINYAKSEGIGLIVMATHGRSGLRAMLMGSVASKVLQSGVAPTLIVRSSA
jgi:nucleotide-binding universal stress UspA family protein